jgi:hypothetical protein
MASFPRSTAAFASLVLATSAILAFAGDTALAGGADDPDVLRLNAASGHALKSNGIPPGKTVSWGHAEILVNAPMARALAVATDLPHYKEFVPHKFQNARIIAKNKETGETDLYVQVPIMKGLVTLWDVLRFAPVRDSAPDTKVFEGKFVRGNVKDAGLIITLKSVDPDYTVVKVDLLILPNVPAPQSAIDEELRDAAGDAVNAIHDRAQGNDKSVVLEAAK